MSTKPAASSDRQIEVARDTASAFGRAFTDGEVDAFVALLAPEVDCAWPSVMQHTALQLNGRDEVRRYVEETTSEYEELGVEPREIRDMGGGRFVLLGWWHAQPRHTASPFATPFGAVLDIRDEKVVRLHAFFDEQLAIDAAGRA